jgi:hypothetical protein
MVASTSALSADTIFQFPDFMTSSSAGEFAGSHEIRPNASWGTMQEGKFRGEES